MSRKKTPKSKGASTPAASTLPATNGPRPARSGTARPGSDAPPNGPLQPGRPSLGGGGDFYDVAFKVSQTPASQASAAGGTQSEPRVRGQRGDAGPAAPGRGADAGGTPWGLHDASCTYTAVHPRSGESNSWRGLSPTPSRHGGTRGPATISLTISHMLPSLNPGAVGLFFFFSPLGGRGLPDG